MTITAEKTVRLVIEPPATYGTNGAKVPGVAALEFCTKIVETVDGIATHVGPVMNPGQSMCKR